MIPRRVDLRVEVASSQRFVQRGNRKTQDYCNGHGLALAGRFGGAGPGFLSYAIASRSTL